tara:strand:- start:339 stop:1145 length:807 start_codon:yes stop_codon:yes gene_type:complete
MIQGVYNRRNQRISRLTSNFSGGAGSVRLPNIEAPGIQLYKGEVLSVIDRVTGIPYEITLTGNVSPTGTALAISSTTLPPLRSGSIILYTGKQQINAFRDTYYHRLHINAVYSPSVANYAKFFLGYGGHYNFNIGTAAWSDGGTKANSFAARFGWFSAIRECTIVETNVLWRSSDQTDTGAPFDTTFNLWAAAPTIDGTSNATMTQLSTLTLTGHANSAYLQQNNSTNFATIPAGSQLIPSFGPLSAQPPSTAPDFDAEIEVIIKCTQ